MSLLYIEFGHTSNAPEDRKPFVRCCLRHLHAPINMLNAELAHQRSYLGVRRVQLAEDSAAR